MANDCHGLGLVCPDVVVSVSQHLKLVLSEAEHFQTKRSQAVSSIQTTGTGHQYYNIVQSLCLGAVDKLLFVLKMRLICKVLVFSHSTETAARGSQRAKSGIKL